MTDECVCTICDLRRDRDHLIEQVHATQEALDKVTAERDEAIKLRDQYSLAAFETLLQLVKEKMR